MSEVVVVLIKERRHEPRGMQDFPCLGVAYQTLDFVVLFTAEGVGTVVSPSSDPNVSFGLGYHSNNWGMQQFKEYNGNLVLSN